MVRHDMNTKPAEPLARVTGQNRLALHDLQETSKDFVLHLVTYWCCAVTVSMKLLNFLILRTFVSFLKSLAILSIETVHTCI